MEIRKNDEFELTIEDMSEDGAGIGKQDGYIWFVKDVGSGDRIRARAMKMKKNYGFARLMEVLEASKDRVMPECPVARQCGGCQLQMMSYEAQLHFKERKVYNNLRRIGGMENLRLPERADEVSVPENVSERNTSERMETTDAGVKAENVSGKSAGEGVDKTITMEPILGMEHPWRYRNKAQFPFGRDKDGRIIAGFYAGRTHHIVEAEDCLLGVEENAVILDIIKKIMEEYQIAPYDEETHKGLIRHALIRKGFSNGELMVCLVINGKKLPHADIFVERLKEVPGMTSISYNINQEKTNVILGAELVNLYGPGYITDKIGNVSYQISPLSFYQVNPVQTEKLYGTALEYAGLTGGVFAGAPEKGPRILLSHQPKHARKYDEAVRFDLQLSGHTHGGQLFALTELVAILNAAFVRGWYALKHARLYVHSGSGVWNGFPVRVGVPSEIAVFTLSRKV